MSLAEVTTNWFYIPVDEVTYLDGGRWGEWSDAGGSSLELIDPDADNRQQSSWADSDESAKAPWTAIECNRCARKRAGVRRWLMKGSVYGAESDSVTALSSLCRAAARHWLMTLSF